MPNFSRKSQARLNTCHPDLQRLFNVVVGLFDCTILYGYRGEAEQNRLFLEEKSKVQYPDGKHNSRPSMAVDSALWPVPEWEDLKSFYYFAGVVKGIAMLMNIPIRWGGDWDSDNDLNDQTFNDLLHFELIDG